MWPWWSRKDHDFVPLRMKDESKNLQILRDLDKYGKQNIFHRSFLAIILSAGVLSAENKCSIINNVERENKILPAGKQVPRCCGRDICDKKCTISEAWVRMDAIIHHKKDPLWIRVLCTGIGSGGFAILFGANFLDGAIAFGIGLLLQLLMLWFEKHHVGRFANLLI